MAEQSRTLQVEGSTLRTHVSRRRAARGRWWPRGNFGTCPTGRPATAMAKVVEGASDTGVRGCRNHSSTTHACMGRSGRGGGVGERPMETDGERWREMEREKEREKGGARQAARPENGETGTGPRGQKAMGSGKLGFVRLAAQLVTATGLPRRPRPPPGGIHLDPGWPAATAAAAKHRTSVGKL